MRIEQVDLADAERISACHQVYLAAHRVDTPEPWLMDRLFSGWLTVGWSGDPREVWSTPGHDEGPVAGWYRLEMPDQENLDRAHLDLIVLPAARRRGIGRALLRHAAGRAAAHGRSVLSVTARNGSPGEAFARSAGAEPGLVDVSRVIELGKLPAQKLTGLRATAERAAAGYSLVSWNGPVPEQSIEQAAVLYTALNDAPHDSQTAPEIWDARRVRERVNAHRERYGTRDYCVAAKHDASDELAALTEIVVDPADPGWGHQTITAVTRKHRGHRLGLLVKIAMMERLATAEPQLERIVTWNARANQHMIAVNDALGYTVLGQPATGYRVSAASLLRQARPAVLVAACGVSRGLRC